MKWIVISSLIFISTSSLLHRPVTDAEFVWESYTGFEDYQSQQEYRIYFKNDTIIRELWYRFIVQDKWVKPVSSDTFVIEDNSIYQLRAGLKLLYFNNHAYSVGDTFYLLEDNGEINNTWCQLVPSKHDFDHLQEGSFIYKARELWISDEVESLDEVCNAFKNATQFRSEGIEAHHPIFGATALHTHHYHEEIIMINGGERPEFTYKTYKSDNPLADSFLQVINEALLLE